jgi:hypothetical protein
MYLYVQDVQRGTLHVFMSRRQIAGPNHCIKVANNLLKVWQSSNILGTTVRNQNYIHEEIKNGLTSEIPATIQFKNICLPVCCLKT